MHALVLFGGMGCEGEGGTPEVEKVFKVFKHKQTRNDLM